MEDIASHRRDWLVFVLLTTASGLLGPFAFVFWLLASIFAYCLDAIRHVFGRWFVYFVRTLYLRPVGAMHLALINSAAPLLKRYPKTLLPASPLHSRLTRVDFRCGDCTTAAVYVIGNLTDNYCYLVVDLSSRPPFKSLLVDCGDADTVVTHVNNALIRDLGGGFRGLVDSVKNSFNDESPVVDLVGVVSSHHHWDHQGGNARLRDFFTHDILVMGGRRDRVAGCTQTLSDGGCVRVGALKFEVIETPCHTRGSVMLYCPQTAPPILFSGDTLLVGGGHGALFEGKQGDVYRNIFKTLVVCSLDSLIFPGHEYTVAMLNSVDGNQVALNLNGLRAYASALARAHHCRERRISLPTVPARLESEAAFCPWIVYVADCVGLLRAIWARYIKLAAFVEWSETFAYSDASPAAMDARHFQSLSRSIQGTESGDDFQCHLRHTTDLQALSSDVLSQHIDRVLALSSSAPCNSLDPSAPFDPSAKHDAAARFLASNVGHDFMMTWGVEWDRFLHCLSTEAVTPKAARLAPLLSGMLARSNPKPVGSLPDLLTSGPPFALDPTTFSDCRPSVSLRLATGSTPQIYDHGIARMPVVDKRRVRRLVSVVSDATPPRSKGLRPYQPYVGRVPFIRSMTDIKSAGYRAFSLKEATSFWNAISRADEDFVTAESLEAGLMKLVDASDDMLAFGPSFVGDEHDSDRCRLCLTNLGVESIEPVSA